MLGPFFEKSAPAEIVPKGTKAISEGPRHSERRRGRPSRLGRRLCAARPQQAARRCAAAALAALHCDCGHFLDGGWATQAATLGWGPLDLFGCDRERPFVRPDHKGLLWLVDGGTLIELDKHKAQIRTKTGTPQTYERRPVEVGRVVLAWELSR